MWSYWPGVNLFGGFIYSSFLDSQKLIDTTDTILTGRPYKRSISTMAVNMNDGHIVIFDETVPDNIRTKAIIASASLPGAFPPT